MISRKVAKVAKETPSPAVELPVGPLFRSPSPRKSIVSFCRETPTRNGKTAPWRSRLSNRSRGIIAAFSEPRAQASGPCHLKAVSRQARRGPGIVEIPASAGGLAKTNFAVCRHVTTPKRRKPAKSIGASQKKFRTNRRDACRPSHFRAGLGCPKPGRIRRAAASSFEASASLPGICRSTIARL